MIKSRIRYLLILCAVMCWLAACTTSTYNEEHQEGLTSGTAGQTMKQEIESESGQQTEEVSLAEEVHLSYRTDRI